MAAVIAGGFVAVGHVLGALIGWWHAYEFTFGKPDAPVTAASPIAAAPLSLVILPIQNASGTTDDEWFTDALTGDLTTELGRLSGAFIISRDTALTYRSKTGDPRSVARELGVRYFVHGTARRQEDRVQLTLALIDGESGAERWAEQKEVDRPDLSSSLSAMVAQLAHGLGVQLYQSAGERAARLKPNELQAEDLAMQGWSVYFRGVSRQNVAEAGRLFEQAVSRDARSVRGWGGVAVVNGLLATNFWAPDRPAALARLEEASQRLQELDRNDVHAYFANFFVALVNSDYETLLVISTAAVERFPSQPQAHFGRALAALNLGQFGNECVEPTRRAIQLGPRDPAVGLWHRQIGTCYFMRGEYAEATEYARRAQSLNPALATAPLLLAASLERAGQRETALAVVTDILKRNPEARAADVERLVRANRNERYREGVNRWTESLRALGLP